VPRFGEPSFESLAVCTHLTPEGGPTPEYVTSLIMFVIVNSQYRSLLQGYDVLQRSYAISAGLNLS